MKFNLFFPLIVLTVATLTVGHAKACRSVWDKMDVQMRTEAEERMVYEVRKTLIASYKALGVDIIDKDIQFQAQTTKTQGETSDYRYSGTVVVSFSAIHVSAGAWSRDFELRPKGYVGSKFSFVEDGMGSRVNNAIGDLVAFDCKTSLVPNVGTTYATIYQLGTWAEVDGFAIPIISRNERELLPSPGSSPN